MCSQVLYEILTKKWSTFTTPHKIFVYTLLLKKLAENGGGYIDQSLLDCLVRLICRIARQSWNEDIEFSKLPQYCAEFLSQSLGPMRIGLEIVKRVIDDMSPSSEHQSMAHKRNVKQFKSWTLPFFFRDVSGCLSKILASPADSDSEKEIQIKSIELVVEIIANILEFCGEIAEETKVIQRIGHSGFWEALKNPATIEQLGQLYQDYLVRPKITANILKILGLISTESPIAFSTEGARGEVLQKVLTIVLHIFETRLGLDKETNLHEFIWLLSRISKGPCPVLLSQSIEFITLINKSYLITQEILCASFNENFISNMLSFWEYICGYLDSTSELKGVVVEVTKAYVLFSLEKQLNFEGSLVNLSLGSLSVLSKIDFIGLSQWAIAIFEGLANQLATGRDGAEKLNTLLQILCAFIAEDKKQYIQISENRPTVKQSSVTKDKSLDYCIATAEIIHHALLLIKHLIESQITTTELMEGSLCFLRYFVTIYIGNSSPHSKETLKILILKLQMDSESMLLVLLLSHIFSISTTDSEGVYKLCMDIFSEICGLIRVVRPSMDSDESFVCGLVRLEESTILEILTKWSSNTLSFMTSKFVNKSRASFLKSVFKLYFLIKHRHNIEIPLMLYPLDLSIAEVISSRSSVAVQSLCLDLLGVTQSISNSDHYAGFFEWVAGKSQLLMEIFDVFKQDPKVCGSFFNFLQELSFNRTERLTYIENKSMGTALFRFCEKVISQYFSSLRLVNSGESACDQYKPISKAIRIFSNIVNGKYANIQILLQDGAVIQTFQIVVRTIIEIPSEEITFCIKIFGVIYEFFKYITGNSMLLKVLIYSLDQMQTEKFFDLIIEGCQSIVQSICQLSYLMLKDLINDIIYKSTQESNSFVQLHSKSFVKVMRVLLILVLGGEPQNISLISFPLFGMINLFKDQYVEIMPSICLIQGPERAEL